MKRVFLVLLALIGVLAVIILFNTLTFESKQINVEPVAPIEVSEEAYQRLSDAIQFKTINVFSGRVSDSTAFLGLHEYIEQSYPLIDSLLDKQLHGLSLLYTWEGSNPDLKPVILMSHQDVVPVDEPTADQWEHDPFSGDITDIEIWGRGTMDDKGTMMAILEAVEVLLNEGYRPERTIYLAFGHDEETGGVFGARLIAHELKTRGVQALFTIDEGGLMVSGLIPGLEGRMAMVNVAEKGYASFKLTVNTSGGHSSSPPERTTIEILSRAIIALDDNQRPLLNQPPIPDQIAYLGPELGFIGKLAFANSWLIENQILESLNARTSTAPTIINGGIKDNVIPTQATATINFRIMPGETVEDVYNHIVETVNDTAVQVSPFKQQNEPSTVSSTESEGFYVLSKTIRQLFPDAVVAPGLLPGGTDSKHYVELSDDQYRFYPVDYTPETAGMVHGINERINKQNYKDCIQFVYQLIKNVDDSSSSD